MKPKLFALLFIFSLACLIPADSAFAQTNSESKKEEKESVQDEKKFSVKLFEIRHRNPDSLDSALFALGSGAKGSLMQPNSNLNTLTVRDFPENIAAIEEALKRLDVPDKSPTSLEFQLHLLAASMSPSEKAPLPKLLEPVVEQLRSTLKFANYRYVSSALNRVSDRGKIDSSGVTGSLFPTPTGVVNTPETPSFYTYQLSKVALTQDATSKESIQIESFRFSVSVPVKLANQTQYRD